MCRPKTNKPYIFSESGSGVLKTRYAISKAVQIGIVAIIVIIIAIAGYGAILLNATSSSTSTPTTSSSTTTTAPPPLTTTSSTSTTTTTVANQSLTWETTQSLQYQDPQVTNSLFDSYIDQNVYEPLLYFNGTSGTDVIPWLAQNYTMSANGTTYNFTLRSGVTFADGEPLNSSAVYFSLNRVLMLDGSTPVGHGTQDSWLLQQLLNPALSATLNGLHAYNQTWANDVLAQDFVQITGPLTFTLHIQNPSAIFPYIMAGAWADIVAPNYVIQHDVALWNSSSSGYKLPYPTVNGANETQKFYEYYLDFVSTCNAGNTPNGCGETYLDQSFGGSQAGTGPYTISSIDQSTGTVILRSNPSYWGGPYHTKIVPKIQTVTIKSVPTISTRELDLQNAAASGRAMIIDVTSDHLYEVANRNSWLQNGTFVPTMNGVSIYGPYTAFDTQFDPFSTNVTNPATGTYYSFQPFSDLRFRLAFADAVNMSEINLDLNNRLGQVATSAIPPGLPPAGSFDSSITPRYSYNLTEVQNLLLDAMMHPLTHFTFANGTAAPAGVFNNTFGCTTLNSNDRCDHPVLQTIPIVYPSGDTINQGIMQQIASVINNISSTYNMGLSVSMTPVPFGQMITEQLSGQIYFDTGFWVGDLPWVTDYLGPLYAPNNLFTAIDGWNLTQMGQYYAQAVQGTNTNNVTEVLQASAAMNRLANEAVMYLWTFYPENFYVMTSNIHGVYYNPAVTGTYYFASMYVG